MKKLLLYILLCVSLLIPTAAINQSYGYYDCDLDGDVEVIDALTVLKSGFKNPESPDYLLHTLRILKAAAVCKTAGATITEVDLQNGTVTLSTETQTGITAPLSLLTDNTELDTATLDSMRLTVSIDGENNQVYAGLLGSYPAVPSNTNKAPISIKNLNTNVTVGSHASDDISKASLERSYRESLELTSESTGYFRYDNAYYPRIKKINDNLYILLSMYGQIGTTLYYSTSTDAVNWSAPAFLYQSIDNDLTYSGGSLDGVVDKYCAVNADACVLDNGDILFVYFMRPNKTEGRIEYPELSGIFTVRGKVNPDNTITFGEHKKVYSGTGWEPTVFQRDDGRIEIYWTSDTYYMRKYGWDDSHRAGVCAMIWSDDGGKTWTPNVVAGDTNYYQGYGVFSQYIGTKVHTAHPELGALPWFSGQMPAVTRLYNGKTLLAAEVKTLSPTQFTIALHTSENGGEWTENLQNGATTKNSDYNDNFIGAGPYLATFPSGEVYLTYHNNSTKLFYGRFVSADGSKVGASEFVTVPSGYGMWSSSEIVASHEVITAAQKLDSESGKSGIVLEHSYLNHRINSNKFAVVADGYTNDWQLNTDAVFVGSESQAQMSVQVGHDKDNIYFLVSRFDNVITSGDKTLLYVADGDDAYYLITVSYNGSYTVTHSKNTEKTSGSTIARIHGTSYNNNDTDKGILIELSIARSVIGLENATEFSFAPALVNADGGEAVTDTLTAFTTETTETWQKVVLE